MAAGGRNLSFAEKVCCRYTSSVKSDDDNEPVFKELLVCQVLLYSGFYFYCRLLIGGVRRQGR